MAKVKLGRKQFDVDSEQINAWLWCYIRGLRCAGRAHEIGRDAQTEETMACEIIFIIISVGFVEFPPSPPLIRIISQSSNIIGDDGTRAIADAVRTNSSVQLLGLVRMCCR